MSISCKAVGSNPPALKTHAPTSKSAGLDEKESDLFVLSKEAEQQREPLPPETLVGAYQDAIHKKETVFRIPRLARSR